MMKHAESKRIVLHADQEHNGIRLLVLISLAFSIWLGFALIRAIVSAVAPDSEYILLLSCFGAIPLALPLVWATERALKRVWPSGRYLKMDAEGLTVTDARSSQYRLDWSDEIAQMNWFFRLGGYHRGGRERRVSAKWLCFCSQLQQGEHKLIAFAFIPPRKAAALLNESSDIPVFHEIFPGEVYDNSLRTRMGPPSRPNLSTKILASPDGRYWLAERRRWAEGFELAAEDFERFLSETGARKLA